MNIIIVGGGSIGLHMAQTLSEQDCSICLVEQDARRAEELIPSL